MDSLSCLSCSQKSHCENRPSRDGECVAPHGGNIPGNYFLELNVFKGLLLSKTESGSRTDLQSIEESILDSGSVWVDVQWSTINYKDALAITGSSPIARKFPLVPGIDFAGTVRSSEDPRWMVGDSVLLNGWGVGESHHGGLAERARVQGDWLTRVPESLSPRNAMAIGTAGYTAMLCVLALQDHGVQPADGEVLVTGASGGVGSVAIALLAKLGYQVVASTGRISETDYLKALGASDVIDRAQLSAPGKPLSKERWAGVVDSVGSHTLANACASTRYRGVVTACGLAGGMDFPGSVAPFILRGVTLRGIDSVRAPSALRERAWASLATHLDMDKLSAMTSEVGLDSVIEICPRLLAGQVRGRTVVRIN